MLGKNSADDILKYLFYFFFPEKKALETICMKCLSLFSGENKKHIIYLSCVEFVQREVYVKGVYFISALS